MASKFVSTGKALFSQHASGNFKAFHDVPGHACPERPAPNATSLGRAFRDAEFHLVLGASMNQPNEEYWYELGSGAYFSESLYMMKDWKQRYWGDHYDDLLEIKRKYDPDNFLWCHHCIGSDLPQANAVQV